MVSVVSRQGRHLQRYGAGGGRLVVGCIPYKLIDQSLEVLVISSQKGQNIIFPKGGWEKDETIEQAVYREAYEEAGVQGKIEDRLGEWRYKSRRYDVVYEGIMFPLNVTEELVHWPEKNARERKWVSVAEAMEGCPHSWMKEALSTLEWRLSRSDRQQTASV